MTRLQYEVDDNMPHFTFWGRMPSLNEYLAATGRNPKAGGRVKRECMNDVSWVIRSELKGYKAKNPVILHYRIFEPNMKRDKDNITSVCMKVIQDALQLCDVIKNDGWANIENFTHDFFVDDRCPRIEVYIEEIMK